VLTDSAGGAVQAGGTLPPQIPILKDQYDACANPSDWTTPPSEAPVSLSLAGYADASKLGSSAAVGVPVPAVAAGNPPDEGLLTGGPGVTNPVDGSVLTCNQITAQLDYQGQREFPPLRATFLAFGFMPVTATAYLTQDGPDPLTGVVISKESVPGHPYEIVATSKVLLRIADVTVNGVPLHVGGQCQTKGPLSSTSSPVPGEPLPAGEFALTGGSGEAGDPAPEWTSIYYGGALAGTATIPPFTGCAGPGGEDLDPLITSTVSGPGNYIMVDAASACASTLPACTTGPGGAIENTPALSPYWTITGGGAYTGNMTSGTLGISDTGYSQISCPGAGISGTIPDAAGPPRGDPGTAQLTFSPDCTGTTAAGQPDGTWQVTQQGTAAIAPVHYFTRAGQLDATQVYVKITGLTLQLDGSKLPSSGPPTCKVDLTGATGFIYAEPGTNPAGTILEWTTLLTELVFQVSSSTCTHTLNFGAPGFNVSDDIHITGSYNIYQGCNEQQQGCKPAAITFTNPPMPGS
jgi:hypothetical protein